jgi:DNA-binding transcriptional LysR family regulator
MNIAAFDLNLLRVFDAIMRERSVTRAGEQIGLSQPAVSAALNRLRFLLDDQLFVRRGHELAPTPRAEDLALPVREALAGLERALLGDRKFEPASFERNFTLQGADFFTSLLMPLLSDRLAAEAPGVRLRFLDSGAAGMDQALQDDAVDIVMEPYLRPPPEFVSSQLLFHAPFVVVAAKDMPAIANLKPGSAFPLDLFCALPHALRAKDGALEGPMDTALAVAGRSRRVVLSLPHFYSVALTVARGRLIAALPGLYANAFAARMGLVQFEPPLPVDVPEIHMFWHRRHDANPAHKWLRERIVQVLREADMPGEESV